MSNVLLTRAELVETAEQPAGPGPAQFAFTYRVEVVDVVERFFYRPLAIGVLAVSRAARRLQSRRLDAYTAYMLIAVLAVPAVVTGTS